MALKEKLEKLKSLNEQNKEADWEAYKEVWKKAVSELQNVIVYKWFHEYEESGLMSFSIIPVKRIEPFIGEYLTTVLEITLAENKYIVLEPVSAVTSEYDGKLELYMRGNIYKKVNILRKILNEKEHKWIVAKSYNQEDYYKFDKLQLEKLIDEWLH